MKKTNSKKSRDIKAGGITEYIASCPKEARANLKAIRAAIRGVTPKATIETLSYFDMPGYCLEGYAYNGMFAWFSLKDSCVRLHVRPAALIKYKKEVEKYPTTRAIVSFPVKGPIPKVLVKKLVKASLKDMIDAA